MNLALLLLILQAIVGILQVVILILGWLIGRNVIEILWRVKYLEND